MKYIEAMTAKAAAITGSSAEKNKFSNFYPQERDANTMAKVLFVCHGIHNRAEEIVLDEMIYR